MVKRSLRQLWGPFHAQDLNEMVSLTCMNLLPCLKGHWIHNIACYALCTKVNLVVGCF